MLGGRLSQNQTEAGVSRFPGLAIPEPPFSASMAHGAACSSADRNKLRTQSQAAFHVFVVSPLDLICTGDS